MNTYFVVILLAFKFSINTTFGQIPKARYFVSKNGFCSTTFFLDSLGNFYKENGCEGRSQISMGTYTLNADKIDFVFQNIDSLNPINSIEAGRSSNDSIVTVTLFTRQGAPLVNHYFTVDAIDISGKLFKTLALNDDGQVMVNRIKYKELRLHYLENIHGRKIRIPITDKDLTIILNFPQLFFNYPKPSLVKGINFSLILKADGLYGLNGKERLFSTVE